MKRIAKTSVIFLIAAVLLISAAAPALALVDKTDEFYVADYANVLDSDTENTILSQNELLCSQTGGEIVVVTVRYLEDDYYADEYAVELFDQWGVGDAERNNGILLLLVTEENKAWLTQGSGIRYDLSDDDINNLLDRHFWKPFDKGDYDGAVNALFPELIEWYEDYYDFKLGDGSVVSGTQSGNGSYVATGLGLFLALKGFGKVVLILIVFAVIIGVNAHSRGRRYGGYRSYGTRWRTPPPPPPMGGFRHVHRPGPGPRSSGSRSSGFSGGGRSRSSGGFRSSGGSSFRGGGGGGRSSGGGGGRR